MKTTTTAALLLSLSAIAAPLHAATAQAAAKPATAGVTSSAAAAAASQAATAKTPTATAAAATATGSFKAVSATAQAAGSTTLSEKLITYKFTGTITTQGTATQDEINVASAPVNISPTGQIIHSNSVPMATLSYRWKHSDGSTGPVKTASIRKAGTNTLAAEPDNWTITCNGKPQTAWAALEVLSPNSIASANVTINVPAQGVIAPTITQQPPKTISVNFNASFTLSVAASGAPAPAYKWQYSRSSTGTPVWQDFDNTVPSAKTATLSISNASGDGAQYHCIATNSAGSVASDMTTLTVVYPPPSFAKQPASATVASGQTAKFSIQMNSVSVGYAIGTNEQWQAKRPGATAWFNVTATNLPGATVTGIWNTDLTIANATVALNGYQFRCMLSNYYGTAYSDPATLTVK